MVSPKTQDILHPVIHCLESYLLTLLIPDCESFKRSLKDPHLSRENAELLAPEIERLERLINAYRIVLHNEKANYLEGCLYPEDCLSTSLKDNYY